MKLRDYQQDIFDQLTSSNANDIVQLDTGAGKTPVEAALAQWAPHCLLVAHRNILITQISEKLAAFGLEHDTISTEHTRRRCIAAHRPHGHNFIRRGHAARLVASVQSIISAVKHGRLSIDTSLPWLIVIDEAHHVVPDNMWGILRTLLPNARIIGFTATPARMDGESLHVDKGGLFDRLVQARQLGNDSARALIDRGYLSGFRAYAPISQPPAPRPGLDWGSGELFLFGDPVEEYGRLANNTRAILMAPAIRNAQQFASDFRAAGIPSACINSTQSPTEIARMLDAFRVGHIRVLTNVDMVGEGFDLPACETLLIATRTASFPRYRQWCGRVLRPDPSKGRATIIDLTGMIALHGMPDEPVEWNLLKPPCGPTAKRQVPCQECGAFFLLKLESCPECGWYNKWLDRPAGFAPGSYEFDIKMVDLEHREFIVRDRREAQNAERMRTELLRPYDRFGPDIIGRTLNALSAWLPQQLLAADVPIAEINQFLCSKDARDSKFWIKNFTRADLQSDGAKAIRVYEKWRKSH